LADQLIGVYVAPVGTGWFQSELDENATDDKLNDMSTPSSW
jgi:hypothetical protein